MELPDYLHGIASESINHECEANRMRRYWAVVLGLEIHQDGDQFCLLWGDNLQEGVAEFGQTPADAINAFEAAMYQPAITPKHDYPLTKREQLESERDSLRAELAKAKAMRNEVLIDRNKLIAEQINTRAENFALAADNAKLRQTLAVFADSKSWRLNSWCDPNSGNFQAIRMASNALASRPYNEILGRVREGLKVIEKAFRTCKDHCYSDGMLHHQTYDTEQIGIAHLKTRQLLTDLGHE